MNFTSNRKAVLLIMSKDILSKMAAFCSSALKKEHVEILQTSSGVDGILAYNRFLPCLVIVEDDLPDMLGSSVCSILKAAPNGRDNVNVFLVGSNASYFPGTNADYFFQKPFSFSVARIVIREFFQRRLLRKSAYLLELEKTKGKQKDSLPEPIESKRYAVDNIFSPYSELSGDCIDYWTDDDGSNLYGFIFDCTGHDFFAYSQTYGVHIALKVRFKAYASGMIRSLSMLLHNYNNDQFEANSDAPEPIAAVLFHISFEKAELRYCSAGMPCFYADYGTGRAPIAMQNPLIGAWRNARYEERTLPLSGVQRLLFCSDGLSELLYLKKKTPTYHLFRHDDVSGIAIDLKSI